VKSAQLFHFHNDTFVVFTTPFGCVPRGHNKIPMGQLRGIAPTTFWHGVGAYDIR